ncbi:MAG: hypothetical protein JSS61_05300 [Verrucomicrobia bacterium]|nr:hypothetical protein [Verrucomicrobiota bacterium]
MRTLCYSILMLSVSLSMNIYAEMPKADIQLVKEKKKSKKHHRKPAQERPPVALPPQEVLIEPEVVEEESIPPVIEEIVAALPEEEIVPPFPVEVEEVVSDDLILTERLLSAYQLALSIDQGFGQTLDGCRSSAHDILVTGELAEVAEMLRNPTCSDLFYGESVTDKEECERVCLERLVRFAQAVGAIHVDPSFAPVMWKADELLERIEQVLGMEIHFPNPYPGEQGLVTVRGIASDRAIQSLYQAWRIKQLLIGVPSPKVLEIGARQGRTAYFARQFGITDYTIIDTPFTAVYSGYFLARTLGDDQVLLFGETAPHLERMVKILPSSYFLDGDEQYDLILNADSLTEMDAESATAYYQRIEATTPLFFSINHERNAFSVNELVHQIAPSVPIERHPYWLSPAYSEEVVRFSLADIAEGKEVIRKTPFGSLSEFYNYLFK